jgi:hypothetical protein
MQELLEEAGGLEHTDEAISESLAAIHERDLVDRMVEIDALMPLASSGEKDALTREKVQLRDELASLGRKRHWKQFK